MRGIELPPPGTGIDLPPPREPEKMPDRTLPGGVAQMQEGARSAQEAQAPEPSSWPVAAYKAINLGAYKAVHPLLRLFEKLGDGGGKMPAGFPNPFPEGLPSPERVQEEPQTKADLGSLGPFGRAASEGVGQLAGFIAGGPATAVEKLGAPGAALGAKLAEKIPEAAKFAPLLEKALPSMLGTGQGFATYNALVSEGDLKERALAAAHGAWTGAALGALGVAGHAAEKAILNGAKLPVEAMDAAMLAKNPSLLRQIGAKSVGAAIEGAGFSGMDTEWWADIASGDLDREAKAMGELMGNTVGVAAMKMGSPQGYLFFKRSNPELNTQALRQDGVQAGATTARSEAVAGSDESHTASQSSASAPSASATPSPLSDLLAQPSHRERTAQPDLTPLYQSGWESRQDGDQTIFEFPGAKASVGPEGFGENKAAADLVIGNMAIHSLGARLTGEAVFGARGFHESGAGNYWIGDDGAAYAVGLDGRVYRRNVPPDPGEQWQAVEIPGITDADGKPKLPADGPLAQHPAIQAWRALVQDLDGVMRDSPEKDLLHSAIETAARGNPDSPSVQELVKFLTQVPADQVAPHITRETLPKLATEIAKLGAGTSNAEAALRAVRDLAGASTQRGEQPNQGEINTSSARPETGDTGSTQEEARPSEHPNADRSGEAGHIGIGLKDIGRAAKRVGRGIASLGKAAIEVPRRIAGAYYEQGPEEVRRRTRGGPGADVAKEFSRNLWRASSRASKNIGSLLKTGRDIEAQVHGKTAEYLDEAVRSPNGPVGYTNFNRLMHAEATGDVPTKAAEVVDATKLVMNVLHDMNREAGNVRLNSVSGAFEPLQERGLADVLPLMAGEDFDTVMRDPVKRKAFFEAAAKDNTDRGKEVTAEDLEKHYEPMWAESDPAKRRAALEQSRQYRLPDTFFDGDKPLQVFEGRAVEALGKMIRSQGTRAGVVSVFGPDLGNKRRAYEQQFGPTKGGIEEALSEFTRSVKAEKGTVNLAKNVAQDVSGISPPIFDGKFARIILGAESLRRSAEIFRSPHYDVGDIGVGYGLYGGWIRLAKTLGKQLGMAIGNRDALRLARDNAEMLGMIQERLSHYSEYDVRQWAKGLRDKLTWLGRKTENWKIVTGDMIAQEQIERMKQGKSGALYDAWVLGFDAHEIASMKAGTGGELYDEFRQRLISAATGNQLPGMGSALYRSKVFKLLFPYNTFFMGRTNAFVKNARGVLMAPGVGKLHAATRVIQAAVGLAASGQIQTILSYLLSGKGWDQYVREMSMAPAWMLTKGALGQAAGGIVGTIAQTGWELTHPGQTAQNQMGPVERTFLPGRLASGVLDLWHKTTTGEESVPLALFKSAIVGSGLATPAKTALALTPNAVIPHNVQVGLDLLGLSQTAVHDAVSTANRFLYDFEKKPPPEGESVKVPFSLGIGQVQQAIRDAVNTGVPVHDNPVIKDAIHQALGVGTGKEVSASLLARRILYQDPGQADRALRYLGEDKFALLQHYNLALEQVAKQYKHETGTPETKEEFSTRLVEAARTAQFGDPQGLKKLAEEVTDRNGERMRNKLPFGEDLSQIATIIAEHKELWPQILTDYQNRILETDHHPLRSIMAMLQISAKDKAVGELRREKLEAVRK